MVDGLVALTQAHAKIMLNGFFSCLSASICPYNPLLSVSLYHKRCDIEICYHTVLSLVLFTESSNGNFNIKTSSGYKFGCLAKIVNYMKVSLCGQFVCYKKKQQLSLDIQG